MNHLTGSGGALAAAPQTPVRSELSQEDYDRFAAELERLSGIQLGPSKAYLVTSRLARLTGAFGFADVTELVRAVAQGSNPHLMTAVIDAMTTNETKWFRDEYPFHAFRDVVMPAWTEAGKFSARVLSAACSSGQEPYSVSMMVDEFAARRPSARPPRVQIVATDISESVLAQARGAEYDRKDLERGLNPERQRQFFEARGEGRMAVRQQVAGRVSFQKRNLFDELSSLGRFDMVYCRNVLIYFSNERKQRVLANLIAVMNPGAYLIVGGSEALGALGERFVMTPFGGGVLYRLRD